LSGSSVEYEGELTLDDLTAGQVARARRLRSGRFRQIAPWVFWILLLLLIVQSEGWLRLVALALGILAYAVSTYQQGKAREHDRRVRESQQTLRGRFHSHLDAEGFRTKGELWEDFRAWGTFRAWEETADHVILYEADPDLTEGRVIPKRLFADQAGVDSLRAILATHVQEVGKSR
jgi:hypothetical protein